MPTAMQNLTTMLSTVTVAELRSRANALPDFLELVRNAFAEIDGRVVASAETITNMAKAVSRESSDEMVALAQAIWRIKPLDASVADKDCWKDFNDLLTQAKSLAGSVISQADPGDKETLPLPLDDVAARALNDAQRHGQAHPLTRTVEVGPDSTGKGSKREP